MVVSAIDGRLRIVHPALKRQETMDAGKRLFMEMPGIVTAEINRLTGSLLVLYRSSEVTQRSILERIAPLLRRTPKGRSHPILSSNRMRRYVKFGMLSALTSSLALLLSGSEKGHWVGGQVFVTLLSLHLFQNRNRLFK